MKKQHFNDDDLNFADLDGMIRWLDHFRSLLSPSAEKLKEWKKHPEECEELAQLLSKAVHKLNGLSYELNRR